MSFSKFSPWARWEQRLQLPQCNSPGVYVLGQFEGAPPEVVDPTEERIVLIAETHRQTLAKRWYQFERSASRGADGHAGGYTFWTLFGQGGDSPIPGWLCVSATVAPRGTENIKGYLQELKGQLLARYVERHGILPCCNVRGPAAAGMPAGLAARDAVPEVRFSPWLAWSQREKFGRGKHPGVYALGVFDGPPPAVTDVLDESVVYLGETCNNSLLGRLYQFERSAFQARDGHSGGWTYRSRFGDKGERLYVSMFPVPQLPEPYRSAFIRHVERDLLWKYVMQWGHRPACNSK